MTHITVTPAYGRDYTRKADVLEAWDAGRDFIIATVGPDMGRYISKPEADEAGLTINIRYDRNRKVLIP